MAGDSGGAVGCKGTSQRNCSLNAALLGECRCTAHLASQASHSAASSEQHTSVAWRLWDASEREEEAATG